MPPQHQCFLSVSSHLMRSAKDWEDILMVCVDWRYLPTDRNAATVALTVKAAAMDGPYAMNFIHSTVNNATVRAKHKYFMFCLPRCLKNVKARVSLISSLSSNGGVHSFRGQDSVDAQRPHCPSLLYPRCTQNKLNNTLPYLV